MGQAGSDQIPFAMSGAVNDTLFDIRKRLVGESYPGAFPDAPNKTFIRAALRIGKATKQKPTGQVADRFGYAWLERQALGGVKAPTKSRQLAIPQYKQGGPRRTTRGVSKSQRPARLLKNGKKFFSGTPRGFRGNQAGIWKREGPKGRTRLRLFYVYEPKVKVVKAFPGYEDAAAVVRKQFEGNMRKRLRQAVKTRRR